MLAEIEMAAEQTIIRDERTHLQKSLGLATDDLSCAVSAIPGIVLASNGILITWLLMGLPFLNAQAWGGSPLKIPYLLIVGFMSVCFGNLIVMLIVGFTGFAAAILMSLFNWSIGHLLPRDLFLSLTGGLAGYLPAAVLLLLLSEPGSRGLADACFLTAHLFIAVFFCQYGARWFYRNFSEIGKRHEPARQAGFQFQIRHLIVMTFWVGLVLAVSAAFGSMNSRSSGTPIQRSLMFLTVMWVGLQSLSIWLPSVIGPILRMWKRKHP